nr:MAG TPA: hypothetical protein [Bacteriophage sp.]
MDEYIKREAAVAVCDEQYKECLRKSDFCGDTVAWNICADIKAIPAADVAPVVRCKGCKHSTLPSELTQRYGKPGTLTCHNMHAPSNRRNVGSNDFCSYGEPREG